MTNNATHARGALPLFTSVKPRWTRFLAILAFVFVIPYAYVSLPLAWAATYLLHRLFERLKPFEREALFALFFALIMVAVIAIDAFLLDRILGLAVIRFRQFLGFSGG